jgi:oligoribonuclease (3'-5' exoribonuclease)
MNNQNQKKKTINKVDTDKTLDLVADGFEHMMNPTQEMIEKMTESDSENENNDGNAENVTLI